MLPARAGRLPQIFDGFARLFSRQTRCLHIFVCDKSEAVLARSLWMAHARVGDNTLTNALSSLVRGMRRDSAAEGLEARRAPARFEKPSTAFRRCNAVPLSSKLRYVDLTLECESCCHLIVRKGVWFMTASTFKCDQCKATLRLTYSDKLALFAKYAHLL